MSNKLGLTNDQHFEVVYRSKIVKTNETIKVYHPVFFGYSGGPNQHIEESEEKLITINMPESEFNRFIKHYGNYLSLMHGMVDPISQDMFEKLMIYIKLKE